MQATQALCNSGKLAAPRQTARPSRSSLRVTAVAEPVERMEVRSRPKASR